MVRRWNRFSTTSLPKFGFLVEQVFLFIFVIHVKEIPSAFRFASNFLARGRPVGCAADFHWLASLLRGALEAGYKKYCRPVDIRGLP